ncbi:hypothetical protein EV426DRAFT_706424 [Tirmania nivea]|nr:hypothetical protein EV426DRAFT_706424 [Tirmania nivea]
MRDMCLSLNLLTVTDRVLLFSINLSSSNFSDIKINQEKPARLYPFPFNVPRRTATTSPLTAPSTTSNAKSLSGMPRTWEDLDTPIWRREEGEEDEWDAVQAYFAYLYRPVAGR